MILGSTLVHLPVREIATLLTSPVFHCRCRLCRNQLTNYTLSTATGILTVISRSAIGNCEFLRTTSRGTQMHTFTRALTAFQWLLRCLATQITLWHFCRFAFWQPCFNPFFLHRASSLSLFQPLGPSFNIGGTNQRVCNSTSRLVDSPDYTTLRRLFKICKKQKQNVFEGYLRSRVPALSDKLISKGKVSKNSYTDDGRARFAHSSHTHTRFAIRQNVGRSSGNESTWNYTCNTRKRLQRSPKPQHKSPNGSSQSTPSNRGRPSTQVRHLRQAKLIWQPRAAWLVPKCVFYHPTANPPDPGSCVHRRHNLPS